MKRLLVFLFLIFAIGTAIWFLTGRKTSSGKNSKQNVDKLYTAKKGDFDIVVSLLGTLESIERHDLRIGTTGREKLTIAWSIEDKSEVKKGDTILRIDPEPFEESLESLQTSFDNKMNDLILAEQDLEIGRNANLANIKAASENLTKAREEYTRYEELDAKQTRKDLQAAIKNAEAAVEKAEEEVENAKEDNSSASFEEESKREELQKELEEKEKKLEEAETKQEKAYHELRTFKQYDYPQKIRQLRESLTKAKLNLEKVIKESQGLIVKNTQNIRNHKARLKSIKSNITRVREDMTKLVLKAPIDGLVYLDNPNRRHWRQPKEIKAGVDVNSKEIIAYIPDLSKFVVKTDIPEDYRSRIELGLPAHLRISAIPGLVMNAKISEIAPIATNVIPWDKNSPKVYTTELSTDARDPRLMPGLTIEIEIIVKTVKNVLFLPVEAVYNREGETYCRIKTITGIQERKIKTGESSIDFIEITEGIKEGDVILLSRSSEKVG